MNNQSSNNIFDLSCLLSGHGLRWSGARLVEWHEAWTRWGGIGQDEIRSQTMPVTSLLIMFKISQRDAAPGEWFFEDVSKEGYSRGEKKIKSLVGCEGKEGDWVVVKTAERIEWRKTKTRIIGAVIEEGRKKRR